MVRLTPLGRKIHREEYELLQKKCPTLFKFSYIPVREDENGWSKWQMWDLIHTFGPYIGLAKTLPFETTIKII